MEKKVLYVMAASFFTFIAVWCVGDVINDYQPVFNIITGIANTMCAGFFIHLYIDA